VKMMQSMLFIKSEGKPGLAGLIGNHNRFGGAPADVNPR
jgi:hypothetical protein